MVSIDLNWEPRPAEENVIRYEVDRRPYGASQSQSRLRRWSYNVLGRTFMFTWRRVGEVPGSQHEFSDGMRFTARKIFRPTYWHNSELLPYQPYEYRVRAINNVGKKGEWQHVIVPSGVGEGNGTITGRVIRAEPDTATPGQVKVEHEGSRLPLADVAGAEKIYNFDAQNIGLPHKVEAFLAGTNSKIAEAHANAAGRFVIAIDKKHFGQRIELRAAAGNGYNHGNNTFGWPTDPTQITLTKDAQVFENAIVSQMRGGPVPPHVIEGTIHGRIIEAEQDPANPKVLRVKALPGTTFPLSDAAAAKKLHGDNTANLGLEHEICVMIGGTNTRTITSKPDGRFTIDKIAATDFNKPITLVSPRKGGYNVNEHLNAWPHTVITLTQATHTFEYAIIPKAKKKAGSAAKQIVLIEPSHLRVIPHARPLEPPFAGRPKFIKSPSSQQVEFDITKSQGLGRGASQSRQVHVFFYEFPSRRLISAGDLKHHYGISDVKVNFNNSTSATSPQNYNDNFHHLYKIDTTTTITVTFDYVSAAASPRVLLAFVAVHSVDPAKYDLRLDQAMLEQVLAGGKASALEKGGVMDFNFAGIITQ